MTTLLTAEQVRDLIRADCAIARKQANIALDMGMKPQHLSSFLTGTGETVPKRVLEYLGMRKVYRYTTYTETGDE